MKAQRKSAPILRYRGMASVVPLTNEQRRDLFKSRYTKATLEVPEEELAKRESEGAIIKRWWRGEA